MRLIEVFTYIYGGKIKGDGGGGDESPGACIGAASELWVVEFWFWPEFRVGSPTKTVCLCGGGAIGHRKECCYFEAFLRERWLTFRSRRCLRFRSCEAHLSLETFFLKGPIILAESGVCWKSSRFECGV